ncbi:MAG TPA: helix-turn-helix transcriptional regulator, partial [Streptosporangiaceae bacterium]
LALAARVGPVRAVPAAVPDVLTAREEEIARLVARGLSNKEVAEELVISPATVARHVANIFTKLDLSSRAQVAAWVAGRGAGGPA